MWGLWSQTGPHRSPSLFPSVRLVLREDQDLVWIRSNLTEPGAAGVSTILHQSQLEVALKPHGALGFLSQGVWEGPKLTASAPKAGAGCLQQEIPDPLSCQSG